MLDPKSIGQGKAHPDATDAYDAAYGKHESNVPRTGKAEDSLPTDAMPKAPDPSPFKIGPLGR